MRRLTFISSCTVFLLISSGMKSGNLMNPLLTETTTLWQSVPFDMIKVEHFKPAFSEALLRAGEKLSHIAENDAPPTFENTVESLERLTYELKHLEAIFFNLNSAETSKEMQQLAQEISPLLTAFYNDITLHPGLFTRVKELYHLDSTLPLSPEQHKLLQDTYKLFVRNGAQLNEPDKKRFRSITSELSQLGLKFQENLLEETNAYMLHITRESDLSGLPEYAKEAAATEARSRNLGGWVFTLKTPSYLAFLKYSDHRHLREEIFRAYNKRGFGNNEHDNQEIIRRIVNLRLEMANLLGYETYADYVLEERMAADPQRVMSFLDELLARSKPFAKKELDELVAFAGKAGFTYNLQKWDWAYFSEKLKNAQYLYSEEQVKPYFAVDNIERGIFDLANKLYGITIRAESGLSVYHPDVRAFSVYDRDGRFLALLYMDYFFRAGKRGGAWMTNYQEQYRMEGKDIRPHVSLVFNFAKPAGMEPALLNYEEVRTFLHEFGHALHGIFSNVTYLSLSGTNVYRDFVELPSQIMENWAEQRDWLRQVAVHFKTGNTMPDELLEKILRSRNFNSGYAFLRQISLGITDMAWHSVADSVVTSIADFEAVAMAPTEILPTVPGCNVSCGFAHIFSGGYAAGYYSYKWAEVLDADAFTLFLEQGIFNSTVAESFRKYILSQGSTGHPKDLYVRFRGREADIEPLFIRSGLQ